MKPRIRQAIRDISEAGDFLREIKENKLLSEFAKWAGYSVMTIKCIAADKLPTPSWPMSKVLLKLKYQCPNWKAELESVNAPANNRVYMTYHVKKLLMETLREHCSGHVSCKHCIHGDCRAIMRTAVVDKLPREWTDEDIAIMING